MSAAQEKETTTALAVKARDNQEGSGSSWLVRVLRELFDDIDWQTIEKAQEQVGKFLAKVNRLIKTFRNQPETPASSSAMRDDDDDEEEEQERAAPTKARWWTSKAGPKLSVAELSEAGDVKAMLERVACFVGYMRILTNTNEALADLDAAKVVSNLFSSSASKGSSAGGYFKRLFG